MRKSFICFLCGLACCIGLAPIPAFAKATAIEVGPFNVKIETPIQVNQSIQVQATVSGGTNCTVLDLEYHLDNTSHNGKVLVRDQLRAYRVGNRRISRQVGTVKTPVSALSAWYIEQIVIRCVNGGVAERHVAYP